MSDAPDPRLNPYRPDLAAEYLEGKVTAGRYAAPRRMQVCETTAPLHDAPRTDSAMVAEALFGEHADVYEEREGWAWVQLCDDGYVGYVPAHTLSPDCEAATHKVAVPRSFVYLVPDIKSPPALSLTLGARLRIEALEGDFARTADGRFLFAAHLAPAEAVAPDFVAVAETMLGAPYKWGGKSVGGIDCSGLVQLACRTAGIPALRDSDMQRASLGTALPDLDVSALERGDLLFWKGHVGIMADANTLLHATAHPMLTVYEPLDAALRRIAAAGSDLLQVNRI